MNFRKFDCIVIGTGAAGYNAAIRVMEDGKKSVAIVTEAVNCGTSRNTGSDKQTYYKLGLGGDSPDSVAQMGKNLFSCGSVDGDNALCEAALSVRCFMNLCELGVSFPVNRYGEYIGYKTDHDPFARATSAGPLTSKYMTEALEKKANLIGVPIISGLLAIEILKYDNKVCGLVCIDTCSGEFEVLRCSSIILATGGPAGIYADSVYPKCHTGTTSLALNAGAHLQNMTEWQYGLASVAPRWNVSGTYMQVLPRFVSIDCNGKEYEFLSECFEDKYEALSQVFLKGYQWPFDSKKVMDGSSVIDLLVYRECVLRKRKVYLDFTKNPFGLDEIDFSKLSSEAFEYLKKAKSCFGKPIERLLKMNEPAVDLYAEKGLDIKTEYLEIALCAQHNNGGISVNLWWQTEVDGLFAAGECAGTHGITRPGGSALNAGQVGSLRAAQYISSRKETELDDKIFRNLASAALENHNSFSQNILSSTDNADTLIDQAQRRMSDTAAAIREKDQMHKTFLVIEEELASLSKILKISDKQHLFKAYKLKDILTVQYAVVYSMLQFSHNFEGTRGSALYFDKNGQKRNGLEELFRFKVSGTESYGKIQEVYFEKNKLNEIIRDVRPLPDNDDFFENVWRNYRINKNIY